MVAAALLVAMMAAPCLFVALLDLATGSRARWWRRRTPEAPREPETPPMRRPLEDIVADVHRLGTRVVTLSGAVSSLRAGVILATYHQVLGECCDSLGITHLLGVLEVGDDQDAERHRVERVLAGYGIDVPGTAR